MVLFCTTINNKSGVFFYKQWYQNSVKNVDDFFYQKLCINNMNMCNTVK